MRNRFVRLFPGCEYDACTQTAYLSPRQFQSDEKLKVADAQWHSVVIAMVRLLARDYPSVVVRFYNLSGDYT